MAHPGGRPRTFETPEQFKQAVDAYIDSISYQAIDEASGKEITKWLRIPSMEGLAIYCGCNTDTLYATRERSPEYSEPIKHLLAIMVECKQNKLYEIKNPAGAIFDLKCNHQWIDTQKIDLTVDDLGAVKALRAARNTVTSE